MNVAFWIGIGLLFFNIGTHISLSSPTKPLDNKESHPCGKPQKDLITDIPLCSITFDDYPCCQRFATSPEIVDISKTLNKSFNCNVYNSREQTPWKLKVTWKLRNNSDDLIWGWRIDTFCTNTQFRSCIQINSRDKIMNWTFSGYSFGAECDVTVRPLPHNSSNYIRRKFIINSTKDICNSIGHECEWEICWPVENFKVIRHNNASVLASWSPSKYYKTLQSYKVDYWCEEDKKGDQKYVKARVSNNVFENITKVILEKLPNMQCTQYFITVTPMFANHELGTRSEIINYSIKFIPTTVKPTIPPDYIKIIILCSVIPLAISCLLVYIVIRSRKRKYKSSPVVNQEITNSEATKSKVFIVHDKHCDLCEEVTHSFVDVLNQTGCITCILDLRCTKEITKCGMVWYEQQLKNCEKVLVICSKEGRKILHEKENKKYYPQSKIYIFILKMMLGRAVHHNNEEAVPVCFDYSSNEDIPYFLSNCPYYSLPSEIEELCFSLHSGPFENFSDWQNRNNAHDMANASITKLKSAIEKVRKDHYNKAMVTKIGRALLGCNNEESRVLV